MMTAAVRELYLLIHLTRANDRIRQLEDAAREVVKWKGSPDTPWRSATLRLEALLREGA